MTKLLRVFAIFLLVAGVALPDIHFWNELDWASGVGCRYSYTSQFSGGGPYGGGSVGCWATGHCYNGNAPDVSWYQWWTCNYRNYVNGSGHSTYVENSGEDQYTNEEIVFNWGLQADGTATVFVTAANGFSVSTFYAGWDTEDCDGGAEFSGNYNYNC